MAKKKMSEKSLENLKPQFTKTNQPAGKNGRKKSKIKGFITEYELSYADVSALSKSVLQLNEKEIKATTINPDAPIILRLFCRYVLQDLKTGNANNIHMLMDRAIGKVSDKLEVTPSVTFQVDQDDDKL